MLGPSRGIKKRCPACEREFVGNHVVCQFDNTLLVPLRETLVGQVLANKYQVLEEIGRGGMSVVYKGRHTMIDRPVAIKMLQSQLLSDQNSILRFQREAQAVGCIAHPNVISVFDCDIHNGQPYIVMDYLVGESLTEIIKRENHISVDRGLKIFIRVTDALDHAHRKGVLHRDLKSSNIMLVDADGQKEVVKVVDFGIAKILPSSGKQAQNLTATGEIFGSPIYMSPEQCQGMPLDARSDIYSTGIMMYEALTGEPPLIGENIVDTMQMHVAKRPDNFNEVRPDLYFPSALESVVFKALEKSPDDRFQSMREFKESLEHAAATMGGDPRFSTDSRIQRTTRQNLSSSRAPQQMPKPILDGPGSSSSRFDQRASSSSVSKADPRMSSAKNQRMSSTNNQRLSSTNNQRMSSANNQKLSSSQWPKADKYEQDASLTSFKVSDLENYEDWKKGRVFLYIFLGIAVIAAFFTALYFATAVYHIIPMPGK